MTVTSQSDVSSDRKRFNFVRKKLPGGGQVSAPVAPVAALLEYYLYQIVRDIYFTNDFTNDPDWYTSMSRIVPRSCFASNLMP